MVSLKKPILSQLHDSDFQLIPNSCVVLRSSFEFCLRFISLNFCVKAKRKKFLWDCSCEPQVDFNRQVLYIESSLGYRLILSNSPLLVNRFDTIDKAFLLPLKHCMKLCY